MGTTTLVKRNNICEAYRKVSGTVQVHSKLWLVLHCYSENNLMRYLQVLVLSFQHLIWSPAHFSCFLGLEQFAMFLIIYSASRSPGFVPVQLLQGLSVCLWTRHLTSPFLPSHLAVMV